MAAGVGFDVAGQGLAALDPDDVAEVLAAHPRQDFTREAIGTMVDH